MTTPATGESPARTVTHLDVEELPRGRVSRVLLEVAHDGLGRSLSLPIMVARGERPGPVFGLTAAIHGDEINGIPVLHRLFDRIDARQLRGTVVGVMVVNVPGFLSHRRYLVEGHGGVDLNHLMPGQADGDVGNVYAHRFLDRCVRHFDYLLDLHTASFGRANSLYVRADMSDATTARMAYLLRPQIILHNPPSDATLRGTAEEMKVHAVTVEIGNPHRFQPEYIRTTLVGIRSVLSAVGMLPRRKVSPGPEPVVCERSRWLYTDRGGLLTVHPELRSPVAAGEVVASLTNVFGDLTAEYRAPFDGVIIGKSTNPVGPTGARIVHLGIPVRADTKLHSRLPDSEPREER